MKPSGSGSFLGPMVTGLRGLRWAPRASISGASTLTLCLFALGAEIRGYVRRILRAIEEVGRAGAAS